MGTIPVDGSSVSTIVTVKGTNLTGSLSVTVSGTGFAVTPSTLAASDVNNGTTVTVTYSGTAESATSTLTLSSSEVSRTVSLTAGKAQSGDDPVTPDDPIVPTGDYAVETWENSENGGYWTREVQGAAFKWYFSNAGIFAQTYDHWNDAIGCRFGKNSDSYIQMNEDVAGTSGLSFYAATYGSTEEDATIQVLYSTDGGTRWQLLKELALTHDFTQYTIGLDEKGSVRFKFQQTAGKRLNLDDIAIYAPMQPKVYFGSTIDAMTAVKNGVSTISGGSVTTEDNDQPVILTVDDNFELSLDQQTWATTLTLDASGETFYVRLASTSTVGEYEGTITATAGSVTAYADVAGEVTAPTVLIGDVNCDGNVNISDVTALINYLLSGDASPFDRLAADVNTDGNVNISDVTALINLLLRGQSRAWNALPVQGGIRVENPAGVTLEVYNLNADAVAALTTSGTVSLPAGIYMVTSDTRSRKVVVK